MNKVIAITSNQKRLLEGSTNFTRSSDGVTGLVFMDLNDKRIGIKVVHYKPLLEFFCGKFLSKFLQAPETRLISDLDVLKPLRENLADAKPHQYEEMLEMVEYSCESTGVLMMDYIKGNTLGDTQLPINLLSDLGKLIAFDLLFCNQDRFLLNKVIAGKTGKPNPGNVFFTEGERGPQLVAIDTSFGLMQYNKPPMIPPKPGATKARKMVVVRPIDAWQTELRSFIAELRQYTEDPENVDVQTSMEAKLRKGIGSFLEGNLEDRASVDTEVYKTLAKGILTGFKEFCKKGPAVYAELQKSMESEFQCNFQELVVFEMGESPILMQDFFMGNADAPGLFSLIESSLA